MGCRRRRRRCPEPIAPVVECNNGFILVLVLFILLVIVGTSIVRPC